LKINNHRNNILLALFIIQSFLLKAQEFTEILGRPTDHSITVNVLFSEPVDVYFERGTSPENYSHSTETIRSNDGEPVEVILPDLLPNTRYFYRTRYKKPGESQYKQGEEHTFVTQRAPGSSFTFTIEADPHPYDKKGCHPLWDIAMQNQLKDSADFMIDLGDTFGDDHNPFDITDEEIQQLHLDCRAFFGQVCHSSPLFLCLGNHEGESGFYLLQTPPNNIATYETRWRKFYYPNPYPDGFYSGNTEEEIGMGLPENYYAWEWGDALFVVVDVYRYYTANAKPRNWDWTIGKRQYDWLKETLETSSAKYKFVFAHHVLGETRGGIIPAILNEWGGYNQKGNWAFDENRPGWEKPLHQLMVDNHVTIFFQGHDHLFAKEEMDGLIYQTVPMPDDSSYQIGVTDNGNAFDGLILPGSGHLRVTVSPQSAKVEYVSAVLPEDETPENKNGDVAFSYTVKNSGGITALSEIKNRKEKPKMKVFPNPFRDTVTISFLLETGNNAILEIFELNGKRVAMIEANNLHAGENKIIWDAKKHNGEYAKPGTYIGKISSEKEILFEKMILVK
jgi:hypothetical protein